MRTASRGSLRRAPARCAFDRSRGNVRHDREATATSCIPGSLASRHAAHSGLCCGLPPAAFPPSLWTFPSERRSLAAGLRYAAFESEFSENLLHHAEWAPISCRLWGGPTPRYRVFSSARLLDANGDGLPRPPPVAWHVSSLLDAKSYGVGIGFSEGCLWPPPLNSQVYGSMTRCTESVREICLPPNWAFAADDCLPRFARSSFAQTRYLADRWRAGWSPSDRRRLVALLGRDCGRPLPLRSTS